MTLAERRLANNDKPVPAGKVTYEEFLAWTDEDTHAEWVDGEIIVPSPVNSVHELLSGWLYLVLKLYVDARGLGRVLQGYHLSLPKRPSGREPDLMFVATEHLARIGPTILSDIPDAVIEIVSPDSVGRDYGDKFVEYEQAGIPEYWRLDPQREQADFYRLGSDGQYQRAAVDSEGVFVSQSIPGFWLRVAWLWRRPLPDPHAVLAEIMGADELLRLIRERVERREGL